MNVAFVRADQVYRKMISAPTEQKENLFRYELMKPFEAKWAYYNIPLKAAKPGGYDILIASDMLGLLPPREVNEAQTDAVNALSDDALWQACEHSVQRSLAAFTQSGIVLPVTDYLFSVLLANPANEYTILSKGYCGDGGIPGYILAWLVPNDYTVDRLPAAIAHEVNHNVRFQFLKWHNDITLGEMLVSEGLAENFAVSLYGEEKLGPWVSSTDIEELDSYIKPVIYEGLGTQGLSELNAYLYGDQIAEMQGYEPVGLPWCAGYTCGYYLIRHYLKKTGRSVVEATLLPAEEILNVCADFWTSQTEKPIS